MQSETALQPVARPECTDCSRSTGSLWLLLIALLHLGNPSRPLSGADDFEREPINYATARPVNRVTDLQDRLISGTSRLDDNDEQGYLQSLLKELRIPVSSQTLVFSKTSLQRQRISPKTPRAIYFNDDTYVGYCQHGDVLEISTADPALGAVFYTLQQDQADSPKLVRQADNCLQCHASPNTRGVPGHFVRSVYVDHSGLPMLSLGTHRIDQTSPIAERWGGWYVTGTHGSQTHLGNLTLANDSQRDPQPNRDGLNVTVLSDRFRTSAYLSPHSDLVALMVLEHQTEGHNLLTRANFQTREALHAEEGLNKSLGEPPGHRWQSTTTRINSACEALVKYLLFSGEAPISERLQGTSTFAQDFTEQGPRDDQGRSLRDFDLERRLFKYPCSYLIYSPSFDALPTEAKSVVRRRMSEILSGTDRSREFSHLSEADRSAIALIIRATKPGFLESPDDVPEKPHN